MRSLEEAVGFLEGTTRNTRHIEVSERRIDDDDDDNESPTPTVWPHGRLLRICLQLLRQQRMPSSFHPMQGEEFPGSRRKDTPTINATTYDSFYKNNLGSLQVVFCYLSLNHFEKKWYLVGFTNFTFIFFFEWHAAAVSGFPLRWLQDIPAAVHEPCDKTNCNIHTKKLHVNTKY